MKILVISNTISNGGDFLVKRKSLYLINRYLGKESYDYYNLYSTDFEKVNIEKYSCIIYFGGPLYIDRLLENIFSPIIDKIIEYKKKIFILGCGWYGATDVPEIIYNYKFSEKSKKILDYIDTNGVLGCRDDLSVRVLKNNGYQNLIMTGCPVWYANLGLIKSTFSKIDKIAISDMGITKEKDLQDEKFMQMVDVLSFLCERFNDTQIIFTFNNGIETKYSAAFNNNVKEFLRNRKIEYYDLSNGDEGFKVYDDCDFHIGYRVHTHLYCLTRGIPSILICEDARGIGMNSTLGFPIIKANAFDNGNYKNNPYLLKELDNEIDRLMKHCEYEMGRVGQLFAYYNNTNIKEFFDIIKDV